MIKVKANLKLFEDGRKTPFNSGYRPAFSFINEMRTSGEINLIDRECFFPGDEAEVEISFLDTKYLGNTFGVGTKFTFAEGKGPLGEGEIKEII